MRHGEPNVQVGRLVELTQEDCRQFHELTSHLQTLAFRQRKGWFAEYVRTHTQVSRLIHLVVERSHAS